MAFGSKMALIIHDNRKYAKRAFYCMMNTGFGVGIMIPALFFYMASPLKTQYKFGSSSEKTPKSQMDGPLSFFHKAEREDTSKCEEPIVQKVDGYCRKPARTKRAELIKVLPVREIPCDIPEEDMFCDQCGSGLN